MGKRELLLIFGFVIAGVVLYRLQAPPTRTPSGGLGALVRRLAREVRPELGRAEREHAATHAIDAAVAEVRVRGVAHATVVGEDRREVVTLLRVTSTGADEPEAARLAEATTLRADRTGEVVLLTVDYPSDGRQDASLTVRVPARLRVRLEDVRAGFQVSGVAAVALASTRGPARITQVRELVDGDHRGGALALGDVGSVRLRTRRTAVTLERVRGGLTLDVTEGSVRARAVAGPVQLDARSADVEVDGLAQSVTAMVAGGRLHLAGVAGPVRCEAQGADVRLALVRPVEVTAFTTRGALEVTLPAGAGADVDAATRVGSLHLDGLDLPIAVDGSSHRARGVVGHGGPRVSLRTSRGPLTIRRAAVSAPSAAGRP